MGWKSLRWWLPFSYAVLALITALALAGMLLLMLHGYYLDQERRYLLGNARTIGIAMQLAESYDLPDEAVQAQVETFSFFTQTRVRLLDAQGNTVADSGSPLEALILRYEEHRIEDEPPVRDDWGFSAVVPAEAGPVAAPPEEQRTGLIFWLLGEFSRTEPAEVSVPASTDDTMRLPAATSFYGLDGGEVDASVAWRSTQAVIAPISDESGEILSYVEVSEGPAYGEAIVANVARGLVIAASAAVLLAAAIGWQISRRISAPVVALAGATTQMAEGNLSARAEVNRRDEIGALAHAFNGMAAQIEATIHTLRVFVSDAAHELHTPLTALHTDLELAAVDPDPTQRVAHLERALEQVRRFEILTANLLDLSRIDAGIQEERRPVDLCGLLAGLSEVYASRAEQAGSTLQIELPDAPLMVQGYDVSLRQAVGNLLDNAIKFTPPGGQVHLSLYQADPWVVILVKDTGIGIPAEDLPHLFRRFHRGRNAASYPGSGLGLAITESIIRAHGGRIEVQSSGEGTCFRVLVSPP